MDQLNKRQAVDILLGFAIGDAMGVPVEFQSREELSRNPVTFYIGFGTHSVPPGTWSDDTSMTLATLDSFCFGLDYDDMMKKFCQWKDHGSYTATNQVFDIGITTEIALEQYKLGKKPLECGCCGEFDNGNGSLMRIIPAVFYTRSRMNGASLEEQLDVIHNVSALTHAHPRSKMACGIYFFVLNALLDKPCKKDSIPTGLKSAEEYYRDSAEFCSEYLSFKRLFAAHFKDTPEQEIRSSGYVVDTLEAAVWCVLNTDTYEDCILKAVNLGNDTDTVAAIAGGLAGCLYGRNGTNGISILLMKHLIGRKQILALCEQFFEG